MAASASDAFHVVIPSLPGYGFSGKPTTIGWDPVRIARAWVELMKRLGYTRFVAQGGDWGAIITDHDGCTGPSGIDRHSHQHAWAVPSDVAKALQTGGPLPSGLSAEERHAFDQLKFFFQRCGLRP